MNSDLVLFAASWWRFLGGHVNLGALLIATICLLLLHSGQSLTRCLAIYFVLCLVIWIIGDCIWGPFEIPCAPFDLPRY